MSSLMSNIIFPLLVWLLSGAVTLAVLLGATPCQVEFTDSDTISSNPLVQGVSQRETDSTGEDRQVERREAIDRDNLELLLSHVTGCSCQGGRI